MFSHAISCQGGVTRAEGEGKERGVSGWGGGLVGERAGLPGLL